MNSYKITVARDDNSSPAELLERAKNENAEAVILNETQARSGDRHVFDEYLNDNTLIFFTKMTDREIAELYKIPFDFGGAAQDGDLSLIHIFPVPYYCGQDSVLLYAIRFHKS